MVVARREQRALKNIKNESSMTRCSWVREVAWRLVAQKAQRGGGGGGQRQPRSFKWQGISLELQQEAASDISVLVHLRKRDTAFTVSSI